MKNTIKINESQLKNIIAKVISEEFKSQKLAQLARDNGGLSVMRNGGNREYVNAFQFGRSIDPANVTDDMLVGEPYDYNWDKITPQQRDNAIVFNGTGKNPQERAIQLRNDIEIPKPRQKASRYGSGIGDTGDHDKHVRGFKTKNSITQQSAPYNGFSVSNRAGESQNVRDAINTNQRAIDFYKNNPDYDPDGKLTRDAQWVIKNLKKRGEKIKNMKTKITESQLRGIIMESIKKVLTETELDYDMDNFSGRWSRGTKI